MTRKPRFQDQWAAKAIDNTTTVKTKQDFRTNGWEPESSILKFWCVWFCCFSQWLWLPIGLDILCFLICLVFSMVVAIHWSWNVVSFGFSWWILATHWSWNLGFLIWFLLFLCLFVTHWSFLENMCMLRVLFRQAKQRINLNTCIWPRRNGFVQTWCFQQM